MNHLRHPLQAVFLAFAVLLSACSTLGLPSPQTFNERLATGLGTVTQIRQSATTLLRTNRISVQDAENTLKQTDNAAEALNVARAVSITDPAGANAKLTATITVLTALQSYLATKEKP